MKTTAIVLTTAIITTLLIIIALLFYIGENPTRLDKDIDSYIMKSKGRKGNPDTSYSIKVEVPVWEHYTEKQIINKECHHLIVD